jgi:hypothetical protein
MVRWGCCLGCMRSMGGARGWTAPKVSEKLTSDDESDSESELVDEPHDG